MKLNEDGKTVAAMDCLVPGIGEIIGGSQREDDYDKLLARMKELGLKEEDYKFYLDLRKYGSTRHAGFGLGFERCVMYLTGMGNIRDVIPFRLILSRLCGEWAIRLKNNYRKLKFSILLQTVLVTALTVLVGGVLLKFVIDGIYNDSFARTFVDVLVFLNINEKTAVHLYWQLIGDNKTFFMIVGYLILFALFFYVALSQMTKYLDQIDHGIENIISESTDPIHLITELKPIEIRLNEIKATLKRQELEALEGEKKKNDLVLFLAHDLKTPLTSIVAYLTMLEDHPDMPEEERKAYTHIALEKSIRLGELINEFFDITRYNLQNIELEPVEIDLTMMLEQLADELYGVLQERS